MSRRSQQLAALEKLSRLRADLELRRFSAYREQFAALQSRVEGMRADLSAVAADPAATVEDWRTTHALAGYRAAALIRGEAELERLRPGFEAVRRKAAVAFGRAEAMAALKRTAAEAERELREKKGGS